MHSLSLLSHHHCRGFAATEAQSMKAALLMLSIIINIVMLINIIVNIINICSALLSASLISIIINIFHIIAPLRTAGHTSHVVH
jgi:hypothetical protein